jgi:hypothetical protein
VTHRPESVRNSGDVTASRSFRRRRESVQIKVQRLGARGRHRFDHRNLQEWPWLSCRKFSVGNRTAATIPHSRTYLNVTSITYC